MPIKFENRAYTQQITLANVMEQINCCHHPSPGEPALFLARAGGAREALLRAIS